VSLRMLSGIALVSEATQTATRVGAVCFAAAGAMLSLNQFRHGADLREDNQINPARIYRPMFVPPGPTAGSVSRERIRF
jgi:hypothetical protein